MYKEVLSYCSGKSINLSERSKGLLAGINHTEPDKKKIQGTRQEGKRAATVQSLFEIAHICPKKYHGKRRLPRDVTLAHILNKSLIFPFSADKYSILQWLCLACGNRVC